jgi:hypothetical protein
MNKAIFYITTEGVEVIDNTPEAEIRLYSMEYMEERQQKVRQKQQQKKRKLIYKLACVCGMI